MRITGAASPARAACLRGLGAEEAFRYKWLEVAQKQLKNWPVVLVVCEFTEKNRLSGSWGRESKLGPLSSGSGLQLSSYILICVRSKADQ